MQENGLQENYMKIEIIIQKYKALGATEIDEVKNERYDFRFCACKNETSEPERSGDCSCSIVVSGQTTQNSIPQALLSYISLSSVPLADSEQPYLSAAVRFDKRERWPDKSLRKLSFTETNMQNFDSIAKIEERLLQSAKKHHLLPAQFNIAIYKDVVRLSYFNGN
ncbi:unnamed protein product [Wuchereria bancrofti]|uniref:Uncharacterized protein n=1 Tax=Wuchereria bancrofti TaxID=6293 RepID=A0A3P7GN22_WUCBA|nr:unnamed protein product [Wuchereria bancrofti]